MSNFVDKISRWYSNLGGLCVLSLICVLLAGIVLREVFGRPLVWANEVSLILFLWIVFIGAAVAFSTNARIRFTLLTGFFPKPVHNLIERFVALVGIGLLCMFLWVSIKMIFLFWDQRLVSVNVPVAVEWFALPVGLVLTIIAFVRFFFSPPPNPSSADSLPKEDKQ